MPAQGASQTVDGGDDTAENGDQENGEQEEDGGEDGDHDRGYGNECDGRE